ncbi:MAG: c-type cytochrome [Chloroflexi bacterium]|nr:c-type cytochrome [Chloroflexota bacterium]
MSTQLKILIGIIFTLLTCIPLAAIAMNDLGHDFGLVPQDQPTEMELRAAALSGRQIEVGADLFGQYCYSCHGKNGEGLPGVAPALNRKDLFDGTHQRNVGWPGSINGFIKNTIAAGRPIQSRPDLYSAKMPTWSQEYGGPMRPDQVNALVAFVMNWQGKAPEVDAWPVAVASGTPRPTATAGPSPTPAPTVAGLFRICQTITPQYAGKKAPYKFDDRAVLAAGKQIYDEKCAACHGPTGRGDGVAAAALNPKPANLADKNFMNTLPVDCHFFAIAEGVKNTGMPPWKSLGDDQMWKVLIYERSFSGVQ